MINIRPISLSEWEKLRDLNFQIFQDNPDYDDDIKPRFVFSPEGEQFVKEMISTTNGICLVAEDNGKWVGYINGAPKAIPYRTKKYFEIENLGIIAEYRGKGIAKKLMKELTENVKEKGFERLYLQSYYKNKLARDFYEYLDFENIDVGMEKDI